MSFVTEKIGARARGHKVLIALGANTYQTRYGAGERGAMRVMDALRRVATATTAVFVFGSALLAAPAAPASAATGWTTVAHRQPLVGSGGLYAIGCRSGACVAVG